jgi:hypothetical protein
LKQDRAPPRTGRRIGTLSLRLRAQPSRRLHAVLLFGAGWLTPDERQPHMKRMTIRLGLIFAWLMLCGCSHEASSTAADASHYAVLVVDREHRVLPAFQKRTPYRIDAASGIRLDVAHFQFPRAA